MMMIVPFRSEHLSMIKEQAAQTADIEISEMTPAQIAGAGDAITIIIDDEVMACIGRITMWKNRHLLWALMSANASKHMVKITKALKRMLTLQVGTGRYEMYVRADFIEGCRWAKILGFKLHHFEEQFLPDGADANVYVRQL
jgi:hypothetical protein